MQKLYITLEYFLALFQVLLDAFHGTGGMNVVYFLKKFMIVIKFLVFLFIDKLFT